MGAGETDHSPWLIYQPSPPRSNVRRFFYSRDLTLSGLPKGFVMKSTYTQEIADLICTQLAEGQSLNAICKQDGMPAESSVREWAKDDREGFAAKYARARELGYERLADEILAISDEVDIEVKYEGEETRIDLSATGVARNRLRVDTRKWMLSKMLPKVYGDKLELASDPKNPLMAGVTVTFVKPDGKPA